MQNIHFSKSEEIAADPSFQRWILAQDPEAEILWKEWLQNNPDRQDLVAQAKQLVQAIQLPYQSATLISDAEVNGEIIRLRQALDKHQEAPSRLIRFRPAYFRIAASILIILGFGIWFTYQNRVGNTPDTYSSLVARSIQPLVEVQNVTGKSMQVQLPDHSSIQLYPNSRVSYAGDFSGTKREVYLDGTAFFSVTKNPSKPFYVYANSLVTKVLGTSFTVQTLAKSRQVKIVVRTGRVAVYQAGQKNNSLERDETKLSGVILTPNQQIVFSPSDKRLIKSLVTRPALVNPVNLTNSFQFHRTPIADVFTTLEKAYGVKISYDPDRMQNCYLTASLTDESLFQKLDLICRTVNASYEEEDGVIVINPRGCD